MRKHVVFSIAIVGALFAASQFLLAAEHIVGGPFTVKVSTRSATVAWIVQSDEVTLKGPTAEPLSSPTLRVESTTFTSLQPYTRYEYNISSAGDAGKGWFKTPPTGSGPNSFFLSGSKP